VKPKALREALRLWDKVSRYWGKVYKDSRDRGFSTFIPLHGMLFVRGSFCHFLYGISLSWALLPGKIKRKVQEMGNKDTSIETFELVFCRHNLDALGGLPSHSLENSYRKVVTSDEGIPYAGRLCSGSFLLCGRWRLNCKSGGSGRLVALLYI